MDEIQYSEIDVDATCADFKADLAEKHGIVVGQSFLFAEDADEALADGVRLGDLGCAAAIKLHINRYRLIRISVTFNNRTVEREFTPGSTATRIKLWAATLEFNMTPEDAGEHVLQVTTTGYRPRPNSHVGALVSRNCAIAFDLVTDERVNGARG